jgi:hypothetical protein
MRLKYPKRDRRKRDAISSESAVLEKRKIVERPSYRWPVRRARAKQHVTPSHSINIGIKSFKSKKCYRRVVKKDFLGGAKKLVEELV